MLFEEPRRPVKRCLLCGYRTGKAHKCVVCGSREIIIGENSDTDFLTSPLGKLLVYVVSRSLEVGWRQAWLYLVFRLEMRKLSYRMRNPLAVSGEYRVVEFYATGAVAGEYMIEKEFDWHW